MYETEQTLLALRSRIPAIGEDIKVMGLRDGDTINLTIACAMVDKYLDDLDHYVETKREIVDELKARAQSLTKRRVNVQMNVGDNIATGSVYITVTGTSAEMGDDGAVGRGNRANGLITPNRPMSLEATSGKNPINHVGKIYNLLSNLIAKEIAELDGVEEVYVKLLSQIGKPINQPHVASVQLVLKDGVRMHAVQSKAEEITERWLDDIQRVQGMIFRGELQTY